MGEALNFIIDNYWRKETTENDMIESINSIINNNKDKMFSAEGYTNRIVHKCGKRRLELVSKVRRGAK